MPKLPKETFKIRIHQLERVPRMMPLLHNDRVAKGSDDLGKKYVKVPVPTEIRIEILNVLCEHIVQIPVG